MKTFNLDVFLTSFQLYKLGFIIKINHWGAEKLNNLMKFSQVINLTVEMHK
jgi:hypothetical protein